MAVDDNIVSSDNEEEVYLLTTKDNPFNPFTQFNEWYAYDEAQGYHTCSYLARVTRTSDELSDEDQALAHNQAINEILEFNILGNYAKVTKNNFKDLSNGFQDVNS